MFKAILQKTLKLTYAKQIFFLVLSVLDKLMVNFNILSSDIGRFLIFYLNYIVHRRINFLDCMVGLILGQLCQQFSLIQKLCFRFYSSNENSVIVLQEKLTFVRVGFVRNSFQKIQIYVNQQI
eukprot:TRINITY_DN23374_c0_g1_i2.p4 TRINITY_DN23374_c0_g1~~TRINITY_DN23374_c0_g1_i2.p4  ORF type:complete len:123 (-),score=1.12 TRINITY_DN23374_c0_g1_i2:25-393(-)